MNVTCSRCTVTCPHGAERREVTKFGSEERAAHTQHLSLAGFGLAAGESAFLGGVPGMVGAAGGVRRPPFLPAPPFAAAPYPSASGALASLASQSASAGLLPPPPPSSCGPPEHVASLVGEESWRAPSDAEEAASPDGKSSPAAGEPLPSPRPSPSPAEHAASVAAAAAAAYRFEEPDRADRLIPKGDPMETRLQEMLRYNMDKFSNQSLDTLQLARRVRELLSVNNIGQRMFARYILGLSQGTVSELLSKPKPWEKLTEKGRDSYRKMHAWAVDDAAVYLLKAVIPKKGEKLLWCGDTSVGTGCWACCTRAPSHATHVRARGWKVSAFANRITTNTSTNTLQTFGRCRRSNLALLVALQTLRALMQGGHKRPMREIRSISTGAKSRWQFIAPGGLPPEEAG